MIDSCKLEGKEKMKGHLLEFWIATIVIGVINWVIEEIPVWLGADFYEEKEIFDGFYIRQATGAGTAWSVVTGVISTIIAAIMLYWILGIIRNKKVTWEDSAKFVGSHIVTIACVALIVSILVSIGMVLLIIPGIILALGFAFTNAVIIDNPDLGITDVIKKSWEIMKGHKGEYLLFLLSFILWIIACILIIPIFYVIPYVAFSSAVYYTKLVDGAPAKEEKPKKEEEAEAAE